MKNKLISLFLLGLGLSAVVFLPHLTNPQLTADTRLKTNKLCNLGATPCQAQGEELALTLSITPTPVKSATPLNIALELEGVDAQQVMLAFEGKDLYMGINETLLTRADDGKWYGQTELAICLHDEMTWQARLVIADNSGYTASANFYFPAL